MKSVYGDVKWCFNASWGLKGLKHLQQDGYMDWHKKKFHAYASLYTAAMQR